jgi:antitoxin PrlF
MSARRLILDRVATKPNYNLIMSLSNLIENDLILAKFLSFLSQDIDDNPQNIQSIDSNLVKRIQSLVADICIDLDAPLADEDE